MSIREFTDTLDSWGDQKIPFLFLIDFEMKRPVAFRLSDIDPSRLTFDFNGVTNRDRHAAKHAGLKFGVHPMPLEDFEKKFRTVIRHLEYGDSYLTNLTIRTEVRTPLGLRDLYNLSKAKYKLLKENEFLFFSPEIFVQIRDGRIFSYPMKGTIDASIPSARERILADSKELAEHVTIVDLLRNDLSVVADHVKVTRFRYIEEVLTTDKKLLQVSSEIVGNLRADRRTAFGSLLVQLLPAGSVSGAPKTKTIEIIRQAEQEDRGYYTGVAGIFDGVSLDSCVMIRFIERDGDRLFYRSGGGITTQSILEKEYQEAIDKIYVPVD